MEWRANPLEWRENPLDHFVLIVREDVVAGILAMC